MVMGKDSGTKCSHCGKNGHNSRTCTEKTGTKTVRLFGVKISNSPPHKREDPMKKSRSMGNLYAIDMQDDDGDQDLMGRGYLSDGPVRSRKDGHERKKGVPWTAEEHRIFLEGLKKLGKGDWRGISRNYVTTRTPAQVASHAQKYFIRQAAATKKKRRSSLFDMEISEPGESESNAPTSKESENSPKQAGQSIVNQFTSLGMQSPPPPPPTATLTRTRSFPSLSGIPYMVGSPRGNMGYMRTEGFPTVSVMPVVNICNVRYGYQPRPMNGYGGYTPVMARTYMSPYASPAAPNCTPKVEPHGSSPVNTDLNLSLGPPSSVGDLAKLPTHSSNMNGAIGVI